MIVSPRTFLRWLHDEKPARKKSTRRPDRPKTKAELRDLILKLARENAWGYTRLLGELRKLGAGTVSRSAVGNLLKEHGLEPDPKRGEGTWADFLKRHAAPPWATDFFSPKVLTLGGFVDVSVLFFLHVGSRRVYLGGVTAPPDRPGGMQQARNVSMVSADEPVQPTYLIRDHDSKFVKGFDDLLKADGMETVQVGPRAANLNAYAARWVQSVKQECLDHFLIFGEAHRRHLLAEYLAHYHAERPHQALDNRPLTGLPMPEPAAHLALEDVVCAERLGGILRYYTRRAGGCLYYLPVLAAGRADRPCPPRSGALWRPIFSPTPRPSAGQPASPRRRPAPSGCPTRGCQNNCTGRVMI